MAWDEEDDTGGDFEEAPEAPDDDVEVPRGLPVGRGGTPVLFHGPGAHRTAQRWAEQEGRVVAQFGAAGKSLKVDEAREIGLLLQLPVIGSRVGFILVGLDGAAPKSTDTLLKLLEERDNSGPVPALWATDLQDTPPTVRSRCLAVWSAGRVPVDEEFVDAFTRAEQARAKGDLGPALTLVIRASAPGDKGADKAPWPVRVLSGCAVACQRGDVPVATWALIRRYVVGSPGGGTTMGLAACWLAGMAAPAEV